MIAFRNNSDFRCVVNIWSFSILLDTASVYMLMLLLELVDKAGKKIRTPIPSISPFALYVSNWE